MSNPLTLNVSDDVINNIVKNNPFYINISGAVNICLIRCGQEIDKCNDVEFSTMTNYGKILVLNPNTQQKTKCNIKLAFDNSNDNINENGESNYTFQKAFVTVPSLHRLNGEIYDMETFLIFSSIQKNGNILYVCLCTLSSGTQFVKGNDWKLLNFKLMNELFIKNNKVPDIYGTNSIEGIPNPVDLSNFIPTEGSRNFYDYTHPNNTNVNIRVFQTPLAVSNEVISVLKSKLTPGSAYESFKNSIIKSINPTENLFFYFSQDLTDNYKSFEANNKNNENFEDENKKEKKSFNNNSIDDDSEELLNEQIEYENSKKLEKLETNKNIISEEQNASEDL
jgi:carbonic anhydrase